MKNKVFLLAFLLSAAAAVAQQKVAILETVDKAGNVSYGVKLLLRSSLTSAISNTDGYEGYDRVDMASIAGEQEFQRTGAVSDNQIKEIGRAAGASYVLVAEAAKYDATSIIITAKLLDVVTFGVKSSAVLVSGVSADEMQRTCSSLASKLLNKPDPYANAKPKVPSEAAPYTSQPAAQPAAVADGGVGTVIVFPDKTRGIVFYKDYGVGLAVSLDETELKWSTARKTNVSQIPDNSDDGKTFTAGKGQNYSSAILSEIERGSAPAAEWCANHGSGWYLPTAGELVYLFKTANDKKRGAAISDALRRAGGIDFSGWYWSSSECNTKEAVNVSDSGWASGEEKRSPQKVRAVRAFSY